MKRKFKYVQDSDVKTKIKKSFWKQRAMHPITGFENRKHDKIN